MMLFVLILLFPRETPGATFFHQYDEHGNHTLNCSQSATTYVWCKGSQSSSVLEFEPIGSPPNKTMPQCPGYYKEKVLPTSASSAGGIFACGPWTENCMCPLFTNITHCSNFDFFIVAVRNHMEEEKAFGNVTNQSEPVTDVPEKGNFTLTCELQIKHNSTELTLYWIKETAPSQCLFSATNEGCYGHNFSYDVSCCVDTAVKERRINHLVNFDGQQIRHSLTVFNASASDSGMYLCVVTIWKGKRMWKVAKKVSIEVKNYTVSHELTTDYCCTNVLQISLGVVGGVILVCGIIWFLYWKKKAKVNPVEERPRNQTEVEMEDDCSPYAVSSRKDIDGNETMYSVVTYPPEPLQGISASPDGKPASESEEKLHTVYALVSK